MDLHAVAHRIGRYRWAEERLFEVTGAWAATAPEPDVKRYLATHCHRHAWHAALWADRQPTLAGRAGMADRPGADTDADAAADESMAHFVKALTEPTGPETTIEKLAGVCRVFLPRLVGAYRAHLDITDPLIDGPTVRVLTLILRDESEAWQEGELLLQTLIHTPAEAARAAGQQARLEGLLVLAGGFAGGRVVGS